MCVNACIPIIILLIMVHQMYLIGGYAYTPEELCEFFEKLGEPLEERCIGVQATQYLNNDRHLLEQHQNQQAQWHTQQ